MALGIPLDIIGGDGKFAGENRSRLEMRWGMSLLLSLRVEIGCTFLRGVETLNDGFSRWIDWLSLGLLRIFGYLVGRYVGSRAPGCRDC